MDKLKIRMEQVSNRRSGNQQHAEQTIYPGKTMHGKEHKYQMARDISSATMCTNTETGM